MFILGACTWDYNIMHKVQYTTENYLKIEEIKFPSTS